MKKLFVLGLSMLAFAACKTNQTAGTDAGTETGDVRQIEAAYDIAYVQMDSLVANYGRYVDLSAAFETKATKIQSDLETRARRLENEMRDFEEKASKGLATRSQLAEIQAQLQTKGQQFDTDSQTRQAELAEENQVMMNQVLNAILEYVKEYNADFKYKMILTTSGNSPILNADPALDITGEILKGLNDEYAAEQTAGK
jgi:outer membrane protein